MGRKSTSSFHVGLASLALALAAPSFVSAQDAQPNAENLRSAETADTQARAYYRIGNFAEAAKEFRRAYDLDPSNTNRLYNSALAHEKAGNSKAAVAAYSAFLKVDPNSERAIEAKARLSKLEAKLSQEAATLAQSIEQAKEAEALQKLMTEAEGDAKAGRYSDAAGKFERVFNSTNNPEFVYEKAESLRMGNDKKSALIEYRRYLRLAPQGAQVTAAKRWQRSLELSLEAEASQMSPTRKYTIIGLGATSLIGIGAGTFFGLKARSQKNDALNPNIGACSDDFSFCNARGIELHDDAQGSALLSTLGFGIGVAAGAAGAILWLTHGSSESDSNVSILPTINEDGVGLAIGTRY